jgi:hypothetical protein
MTLAELKNKARSAAKRVEDRLTAAIGEGRELTSAEESANTADEAELATLNAQIATAEGGSSESSNAVQLQLDGAAIAATAAANERTRILALVDLCPSSSVSDPLRAAIDDGQEAGAFAIGLAQAAKTRGASMEDLRDGTVQDDQLPANGKQGVKGSGGQKKPGLADRLATLGHRGMAHLKG